MALRDHLSRFFGRSKTTPHRHNFHIVSSVGSDYIKETRMIAGNVLGGNLGVTMGLDAGNISKKESTWPTWPMTADQIIWRFWTTLVARSRECANNNDHGRRYMHLVRDNVVGSAGVRLRPLPLKSDKTVDHEIADCITRAWEEYSLAPEITGQHDMVTRDRQAITSGAQDGEILAKKVYGKDAGPYGFGLQMLDPFLLDPHYNQDNLPGGTYIRAGIEYNKAGRPIAYHLRHTINEYWGYSTTVQYDPVPADQIIHCFSPDLVGQRRGMPWMRTALQRFWHIKGFETASVINARVSAAKLGFFRDPEADPNDEPTEMDAEPGVFEDIGSREFVKVDWNWPTGEFAPFLAACLRHASSGLNVANHSLTGDYSGLSYAVIRAAMDGEQEGWKALQVWFAMAFKRKEFIAWLEYALLSGKILDGNGRPLPAENIDIYKRVKWIGRRWAYLDPLKEVSANIQSIIHRLKSRTEVIEENDGDASETWQQIADEEEELEELGIDLPVQGGGQQTPNLLNSGPDANGNDDPDTGSDPDARVKELEADLSLMRNANRMNATLIAEREMEIARLKASVARRNKNPRKT